MRLFTDYPFTELGDTPHVRAPIRCVRLLGFDGNKYAKILVEGRLLTVKSGYLYCDRARLFERRLRRPRGGSFKFFMGFYTAPVPEPGTDMEHVAECTGWHSVRAGWTDIGERRCMACNPTGTGPYGPPPWHDGPWTVDGHPYTR